MTCTFICLLLNSFDLHRYSSKSRKIYTFFNQLCCWCVWGKDVSVFLWETGKGFASFLKFSTSSQNAEFHIHQSHMEIGLSEVIKFCTRKLIKRTHFTSPLKMINLFQDMMPNFSPKNVGLEISRPAIFMINRTQLKPKNH